MGAHTKGRHGYYSLKERVSPLGHPSLPQSQCIYRRGGKPPSNSITHTTKPAFSTTNKQSCLNSPSQPTKDTAMKKEYFEVLGNALVHFLSYSYIKRLITVSCFRMVSIFSITFGKKASKSISQYADLL